jgi:hypothetical protein
LRKALKQQSITLLHDAVRSIEATQVYLASGASLACDVPLLAAGVQPPAWLSESGLPLDAQGDFLGDLHALSPSHAPAPHTLRTPAQGGLALAFGGKRYSVARWGNFSAQAWWVWWLKNWIDRRFVARYTKGRA